MRHLQVRPPSSLVEIEPIFLETRQVDYAAIARPTVIILSIGVSISHRGNSRVSYRSRFTPGIIGLATSKLGKRINLQIVPA